MNKKNTMCVCVHAHAHTHTENKNIPRRVLGCWHNPIGQLMHVESQDLAVDVE